jgi:hypothetical protein
MRLCSFGQASLSDPGRLVLPMLGLLNAMPATFAHYPACDPANGVLAYRNTSKSVSKIAEPA